MKALERQIDAYLQRVEVHNDFVTWALQYVRHLHAREVQDRSAIYESVEKAYRDAQRQLDQLLDLRLRGQVSDAEYDQKRTTLKRTLNQFKEHREDVDRRADQWRETAERAIHFAARARYWLTYGSLEDKRLIVEAIGSNFGLDVRLGDAEGSNLLFKDRKLTIKPVALLEPLAKASQKSLWQALLDDFRNLDWFSFLKSPSIVLQGMEQALAPA